MASAFNLACQVTGGFNIVGSFPLTKWLVFSFQVTWSSIRQWLSSHDFPPVSSGSRQSQDLDLWLSSEDSPRSAGSVADEGDAGGDDADGLAKMTSLRKRMFSGIPE